MNWLDIQDIRQLEGLVRAHVVLAMMVGSASVDYESHLLKAHFSLTRILWQGVENGMHAIKEIAKLNVASNEVGYKHRYLFLKILKQNQALYLLFKIYFHSFQ